MEVLILFSLKTLITGILVKKIYKARATARTKEELKRVVGKEESSDDHHSDHHQRPKRPGEIASGAYRRDA